VALRILSYKKRPARAAPDPPRAAGKRVGFAKGGPARPDETDRRPTRSGSRIRRDLTGVVTTRTLHRRTNAARIGAWPMRRTPMPEVAYSTPHGRLVTAREQVLETLDPPCAGEAASWAANHPVRHGGLSYTATSLGAAPRTLEEVVRPIHRERARPYHHETQGSATILVDAAVDLGMMRRRRKRPIGG